MQVITHRGFYVRFGKPALDRLGAVALLLAAAPVILVAMLAVLLTVGRPVLFKQQRVGLRGRKFWVYKLRTMVPDRRVTPSQYTRPERRMVHKSPDDPRVAPVGRILRRSRIDELPQLWNVLRGDMSLVGPRPELPEIVAGYAPWQHRRHDVKPGLSGLWQVSRHNGDPMHEFVEVDLDYIDNIGFLSDLAILARTPVAMLYRQGH